MSQTEILDILTHPMTSREIATLAGLPIQSARCNLTRMRKNASVVVVGKEGKEFVYEVRA